MDHFAPCSVLPNIRHLFYYLWKDCVCKQLQSLHWQCSAQHPCTGTALHQCTGSALSSTGQVQRAGQGRPAVAPETPKESPDVVHFDHTIRPQSVLLYITAHSCILKLFCLVSPNKQKYKQSMKSYLLTGFFFIDLLVHC